MLLLLLLPVAVALVVLSVLGFAGIGPLTSERRASLDDGVRAIGPVVGLLVGIVLLVATVLGSVVVVGIGGGDRGRPERTLTPSTTATAGPASEASDDRPGTTPSRRPTVRRGPRPDVLGTVIAIEADGGKSFPVSYDVADGLAPSTVLRVRVAGFEPFARAVAEQCTPTLSQPCRNAIPVQFDADGVAEFQYLVTDFPRDAQSNPGRCRAEAAPCTVVVRAVVGSSRGQIQTVFGDQVAPAGHISVTPAAGLSLGGETVTVEVTDYPPGVALTAMLCAAPDATGARCGAPGPTAPLVVGRDGTGRTALVIEPSRVGTERTSCFRGDDCGVSVASATVFARAPVVPISFAAPPGAVYDSTRLLSGLGIALMLLLVAAGLLRRTDWSPVGEASAPEIDDAEYADLDAIIAALPPAEDEPVTTS